MKLFRQRIELTKTGRIVILGLIVYVAVAGLMIRNKRQAIAAPSQAVPATPQR